MSEETAFRDAIRKARRESVEVPPQFDPISGAPAATEAPPASEAARSSRPVTQPTPVVLALAPAPAARTRYEVRIEPLRGSRRRRERKLAKAARKGWEIVAVVRDEAYLQRPER